MFSHCDTWPKARWHVTSSRPVVELAAATSAGRRHNEYRVAAWQPMQTNRLGMYRTAKYISSSTSVCQYTTNTADQLTGLPTNWPVVRLTSRHTDRSHPHIANTLLLLAWGFNGAWKCPAYYTHVLQFYTRPGTCALYICARYNRDLTVHSGVLFQKQTDRKIYLIVAQVNLDNTQQNWSKCIGGKAATDEIQ